MIVHIPDYQLGYRIFSLAFSDHAGREFIEQGLDYLCVRDGALYAFPDEVCITNDEEIVQRIMSCAEYSVFEISDNGSAYLYFDASSDDNTFIITGKCNSNCIMCPDNEYVRSHGRMANIEALLSIIDHIPYYENHFTITGGEPFLMGKDIFRFFAALKDKFPFADYLLLTNGRIFSVLEYARLMAETMPEKTMIGIPVHGYNEASHDAITQTAGSFRQTIAGIKQLLSRGLHIEIRIVVSKISAPYISQIAELIVNELTRVDCVKIMGIEMLGSAHINQDKLWISYREAFIHVREAIRILLLHGVDTALYNFPLCAVDREYWNVTRKSISEWKIRFPEACASCTVKDACGGLFAGSFRFAQNDVTPVSEECKYDD